MDVKELKDLLAMDTHGLLDVRAYTAPITHDERLVASFEEINAFIDKNGRLPSEEGNTEMLLFYTLDGIRKNPQKISQLKEFDRHNLLKMPEENSIAEVVAIDDFGLLDDDIDEDIFNLKHVPDPKEGENTDFVANRKPCPDFEKYEAGFKLCQAELKSGKRKLEKFNERQRVEGQYFVHNGILLLLEKIYDLETGPDGKLDGRTRIIFENGTMSNMRFRSITKRLFENGQHVSDENFNYDTSGEIFNAPTADDSLTGYIYVLSSKSRDTAVKSVKNLFKIGYAETDVKERIKNAAHETTYLMAPVRIVATYKTYNLNPQKFENLLHRFFDSCRVSIDVCDQNGSRHTVREWFQIPFDDIDKAVDLLINGSIVKYKYERDKGIIKLDE